jgi:hypothetical protein
MRWVPSSRILLHSWPGAEMQRMLAAFQLRFQYSPLIGKDKPLKEAWAEIDDRIMDEHSLEGLQVRLDLIIERQGREKASG